MFHVDNLPFVHFFCLCQIFKNKYKDEFYPYLLPKSHCSADQLSFTVPGSAKAKVQVFQQRMRFNSQYCWQMGFFLECWGLICSAFAQRKSVVPALCPLYVLALHNSDFPSFFLLFRGRQCCLENSDQLWIERHKQHWREKQTLSLHQKQASAQNQPGLKKTVAQLFLGIDWNRAADRVTAAPFKWWNSTSRNWA